MAEPLSETQRRPRASSGAAAAAAAPELGRVGTLGATSTLAVLVVLLALVSGWHLTQGTSGVGLGDLLRLLIGQGSDHTQTILSGSRIPRLTAGIAVGFALGTAGVLFQSLARNALASPDTLAVTAGGYLAVVVVTAFGIAVPFWAGGLLAFGGGLLAALLVLGLAGGGGTSTTRLVLAGTAVALALHAATSALLILFAEETTGLFAWGSGSLSQLGLRIFLQAAPVVVLATSAAIVMSRRLDLLGLGDDTAGVLGVPVRMTRIVGVLLAVLLTAASVGLAGPIGFVGLCAPVVARLMSRVVPALHRHVVLIPAAGLVGAVIVIAADVLIRLLVGADEAISIPTGVTTTLLGAAVMVVLARQARDSGPARQSHGDRLAVRGRTRFAVVFVGLAGAAVITAFVGLLAGDTWLRGGDLVLWLQESAHPLVMFSIDERSPRVAAAMLAGAALALSGSLVQATARNPLAEPGVLGVTGGAGIGAVILVTSGSYTTMQLVLAAMAGALAAFAVVYGLSWRHGVDSDRLVLIGMAVWYGSMALMTFLLMRANPWDTPRIFTWLSGTTYGRTWPEVLPVAVALVVALPLAFVVRRELDLLSLDEDTPRLVGIGLERTRLLVLTASALVAACAVAAVGVVAFVGLVAPHAARALVGGHHARSVPVAVLLGAVLLGSADAVGRSAIAPSQIPAGLIVALIGAPYFVYLLARSRA